jgi:hypothetical protein
MSEQDPSPNRQAPSSSHGTGASTTSPSQAGNRPASGARQATPGEILSSEIGAPTNAGDFLGLDVEFTADPNLWNGSSETGAPKEGPLAGLSVSLAGSGAAPSPAVPSSADEAQAHLDALEAELASTPHAAQGSQRRTLLVGLLVVTALAGLGTTYVPTLLQKFGGSAPASQSDVTARGTKSGRTPKGRAPTGDESPAPLAGAATLDTTATGDASSSASAGATRARAEAGLAAASTTFGEDLGTALARSIGSRALVREAPRVAQPGAGDLDPLAGLGVDPLDPALQSSAASEGSELLFEGELGSALDPASLTWATSENVDMIWRGTSVPMEAISAPAKVLTPRVGAVRVTMASGELFDGRLFAVGLARVWIDAKVGRIGLDGERVTRIERLSSLEDVHDDPEGATTGKRVRVKTLGGVLVGRILSIQGTRVTLLTDEGGRITLDDPVLEPLPSSRAILVEQ